MNPNDYRPAPQPPLFDSDSAHLFNRQVPLALLKQAANSSTLPENLRAQIAAVAWVRAVALGDDGAAQSLAPTVLQFVPALKSDLEKFAAEKTVEDRHFAAIFTILKNPGLRPNLTAGVPRSEALGIINPYRDNWWCAPQSPDPANQSWGSGWTPHVSEPLKTVFPGDDSTALSFLTDEEKKSASAEWRQIMAAGFAPDYLTQSVLDWAKTHPDDERVPEALYLAVRSTRFGCTGPSTAKLSKQAFEILHAKYPKTPWAEKTKYWYGAN